MTTVPSDDIIEQAVQTAGRAPSLHNSQPWRWEFEGDHLDLYSVRQRTLPEADPAGRQMILSCGIVLDHLRAALAALGWRIFVAYLPDPNRRDHLATVRFAPSRIVTAADHDRAAAIERRYTERLPLRPPAGWDDFEIVLRSAIDTADAAGATMDVVPDDRRGDLARASQTTAAVRYRDPEYQAEMLWWTGVFGPDTGVPRTALISAAERTRVPIARDFPMTHDKPRHGAMTDHATVLILSTETDTAGALLRCGEMLSRVLLECTMAGYRTCTLTHLTEDPRSRTVVGELVSTRALPQALVRVGTAPRPDRTHAPTARLPLREILRRIP
jgi:hypothetical protein